MNVKRYAYVKNGDPIDQLEELAADAREVPQGGPNAFIADFLNMTHDDMVLILSGVDRSREKMFGNVDVRTFASHLSNGNALRKAQSRLIGVLRLGLVLYRFRPDIVICGRTREILWVSWLVARLRSATVVHSRHNRVDAVPGQSSMSRIYSRIDNWIIRRCDAVVCHGPYLMDQLINIGVGADRIFEFDSGFIDFTVKDQNLQVISDASDRRQILFVGRVEESKGVIDLFDAILDRLLNDETIELVYVGDGSAIRQLRVLVASHGVEDRVTLAGRVNHEMLPALLARAYLLVMPTRSTFPEGRCMSVMEGLVMGLPVIAPEFGPFPYLVKDKINGILYEPDSVEGLGRAINLLLDDYALYKKLSVGARSSGEQLKIAPTSFAGAIAEALRFAGRSARVSGQ